MYIREFHTYVHVYMCVYEYIYIHIFMYIHVHHTYVPIHMHTNIYKHNPTHKHVRTGLISTQKLEQCSSYENLNLHTLYTHTYI